MQALLKFAQQWCPESEGQDLVEYAMLLGFIALVAIVGVTALGTNVGNLFNDLAGKIPK